jgi:ABC-2 type transport system permease protein
MNALTGTDRLIRLALRRDRYVLAAWVLVLTGLTALFTQMAVSNLPTRADVVRETQFMAANPGMRLLSLSAGASEGAYAMSRGYVTLAILAAVMSALTVVRHTRQNEETGCAELLGAGVVGPSAGLAAGVTVALTANALLTPLLGLAMIVNGQPVAGSLAAGAAIAGVGVAFTGLAALTSQLARTARGASGLALAALAVSFLLTGVGNMLGGMESGGVVAYSAWPTWLSPIGWGFEMRPFGADRWWMLALFGASAAVLIAVAGLLAARRDLGGGLFAERTGRDHASTMLRRPFGLAWRLQRPAFLGWLACLVMFGLIFGSVSESVQSMDGSASDWYEQMGGTEKMLDAWFTSMIEMFAIAVAIYVVQVLLRMRHEEARGRLEPVLAAAVSRPRWAIGHLLSAGLGATVLLLTSSAAMALTAGRVVGDTASLLGEFTAAALAQLPAVLVIAAVVVMVVAVLPRWAAPVSWLLLGVSVLLSPIFGITFGLPQWVMDLSPFTHQKAPALDVGFVAIVTLLGVCAALVAAGVALFRRRDLVAG